MKQPPNDSIQEQMQEQKFPVRYIVTIHGAMPFFRGREHPEN